MKAPLYRNKYPGRPYQPNTPECRERSKLPQILGRVACCVICGRITSRVDEDGLAWCAGKPA